MRKHEEMMIERNCSDEEIDELQPSFFPIVLLRSKAESLPNERSRTCSHLQAFFTQSHTTVF